MKTIAFEEHFTTKSHQDAIKSTSNYLLEELLDLGEARLKMMDEAGVDMQVLSLVQPGLGALEASTGKALAIECNDMLAEVIRKNPTRYTGLACMAPQAPEEAAKELERSVRKLGLKGGTLNSHCGGEYLDDKKYWPIFEAAERLNAPIYLHPQFPSAQIAQPYMTYPMLAGPSCGFAAEVALHVMRLIASGLFDKYPKLTLVLGHLGEALPYWFGRMDKGWRNRPTNVKRLPTEYIKDNFFITTSGMFWVPPLLCAYLGMGADRILFAVDHPYESSKDGVEFIKSVPICDNDKAKICHLNAERLLVL
ncbi:amidohydrolase family protein [Chloroflexota bacterium]